jgi:predicted phage terminase large subunit-like protein
LPQNTSNENDQTAYDLFRHELLAFAEYVQHGQYQTAPHLREFAQVLMDVEAGRIPRVINNWPPRHGKTLLLKLFMAWWLGKNPDRNIIYGSYTSSLALQTSRHVRNIVKSERFQNVFPKVALAGDSQAVDAWSIADHTGGFRAVGVGGSVTGHGGDLVIIDDPHKGRQEAESEIVRNGVWNWFTIDIYSRLEPGGAVIVNLTRWHEDDLCGRLIAAQGTDEYSDHYLHIVKPALDENEQALWPERYPAKRLKQIRATVGPYDWQSLYQGNPTPPEGAMFKREWFANSTQDFPPVDMRWAWSWDLAVSTKDSADYTVGAKTGIDRSGNFWIGDIVRLKAEWPDVLEAMASVVSMEPYGTLFGLERTAFQLSAIQQLRRDPRFRKCALLELLPDKDKESRARPFQAMAQAGMVKILRGEWNQNFLAELFVFPLGKNDDQLDAVAYGHHLCAGNLYYSLDGFANGEESAESQPVRKTLNRPAPMALFDR